MQAEAGTGSGQLSEVKETAVLYKMGIMGRMLPFCGPVLAQHKEPLLLLLKQGFCCRSPKVNEATGSLLRMMIQALITTYPLQYRY